MRLRAACQPATFVWSTVYDIPDTTFTIIMTLLEPGSNAPGDKVPTLTYSDRQFKEKNRKVKTLRLHVQVPLLPDDIKVEKIGGDESRRTVSWRDPAPKPTTGTYSLSYKHKLESKTRDASKYTDLEASVSDHRYIVTVPTGSLVKCTSTIVGMSEELVTYCRVEAGSPDREFRQRLSVER